jgi:hypothetical protein
MHILPCKGVSPALEPSLTALRPSGLYPWMLGYASIMWTGWLLGRRRSQGAVIVASGTLMAVVFTACAPQAPDHSSWRDQAHLSISDVASNVSTMSLLLRLVREGRVLGKYQQIVALNSETNAGRTADHISAEQPETRDDAAYKQVTTVLSDATDLLSEVRIALVRREKPEYRRLAHELTQMSARLDKAESRIQAVNP